MLPTTKILNMDDLAKPDFAEVNLRFDTMFGGGWPIVTLRRWEYVAAIVFSGILNNGYQKKCLDAGSGQNVFAQFLSSLKHFTVCIDIGAHDRIVENIWYRNMSMTELKFEDETFDYVFAISSIEHVNAGRFKIAGMPFDTGDDIAMTELMRVLKPGGQFLLDDNVVPEDDEFDLFYNTIEKRRDYSHFRTWKKTEWLRMLELCGFKIIEWHHFEKTFYYDAWCSRMDLPEIDKQQIPKER